MMNLTKTMTNYAKRRHVVLEVATGEDRFENEFEVINIFVEFCYYGNTDIDCVATYRINKDGSLGFMNGKEDHDFPALIKDWEAMKPVVDYAGKTFHEVVEYKD